ncbi:MAG: diacylglycerol kinase family protein [Solirubrobacterales bacterium]
MPGEGWKWCAASTRSETRRFLAVLPCGNPNLLASHLGIETDIPQAAQVALHGERRRFDVGRFEGERFAVMAGAGLDAAMIRDSDELKDRLGRAAYVVGGRTRMRRPSTRRSRSTDPLVRGPGDLRLDQPSVSCSAVSRPADAEPDDGTLDIALIANGPVKLARAAVRTAVGDAQESPFVRVTQGLLR